MLDILNSLFYNLILYQQLQIGLMGQASKIVPYCKAVIIFTFVKSAPLYPFNWEYPQHFAKIEEHALNTKM